MGVTGTYNGTLALTDNLAGSVQLQKLLNISFLGTISEYSQNQLFGTSPTSIALPISPVQFFYIKNLSTTATVAVTWTPTGGSSAAIQTLQPGAVLMFSQTGSSGGITALSVTASAASTPTEFVLLG